MLFQAGCNLDYVSKTPTAYVFNLEAARFEQQAIRSETLKFDPPQEVERFLMPESGNRYVRIQAKPGPLRVEYRVEAELSPVMLDPGTVAEVPQAHLPLATLTHLAPSRFCESDRLSLFAHRTFGEMPMGHQRVTAICNWICDNVDYKMGTTDEMTSAADTLIERQGVCRDFAHLAIALCRALGIPARYISAYAWRLEPPDFHAVFEAWLAGPQGGGWYVFDATRKAAPNGLIRIGIGRDAGEVAFANMVGECESGKPEVWIKGPDHAGPVTTQAVSMAGH